MLTVYLNKSSTLEFMIFDKLNFWFQNTMYNYSSSFVYLYKIWGL